MPLQKLHMVVGFPPSMFRGGWPWRPLRVVASLALLAPLAVKRTRQGVVGRFPNKLRGLWVDGRGNRHLESLMLESALRPLNELCEEGPMAAACAKASAERGRGESLLAVPETPTGPHWMYRWYIGAN